MKVKNVEITHPDKVLFPEKGLTKLDLARYYERVADRMLPFLKDRPLTLQRFPDGIGKAGFYQKNAGDYFPDFVRRVKIRTSEGMNEQVVCNDVRSLIYLVNQGTITFHTWLSRRDRLERPDKIVFDLDPPEGAFDKVKEAVMIVKEYLEERNVKPQLMSTGKSGFHLWYSRRRTKDFDDVREMARKMAEEMAERHPKLLTTEVRKDARKDRIFLDYLRNAYGQTSVCPYSVRPVEEASVAAPLDFKELEGMKSAREVGMNEV